MPDKKNAPQQGQQTETTVYGKGDAGRDGKIRKAVIGIDANAEGDTANEFPPDDWRHYL
jgi:hypothetical protein